MRFYWRTLFTHHNIDKPIITNINNICTTKSTSFSRPENWRSHRDKQTNKQTTTSSLMYPNQISCSLKNNNGAHRNQFAYKTVKNFSKRFYTSSPKNIQSVSAKTYHVENCNSAKLQFSSYWCVFTDAPCIVYEPQYQQTKRTPPIHQKTKPNQTKWTGRFNGDEVKWNILRRRSWKKCMVQVPPTTWLEYQPNLLSLRA